LKFRQEDGILKLKVPPFACHQMIEIG